MKIILNNCMLAVCLLLTTAVNAASPQDMTAQYYRYIANNQWDEIAGMLHETALHDFKSKLLPLLQTTSSSGKNGLLQKMFGKGATFADAEKAADKVFFVNLVGNAAGLIRSSGIKNTQTVIIGNVAENDNVVHVLVRENYMLGDMALTNMEVLSFKKSGNGWSMLLSGKILGMVQTLQTSTYQLRNRTKRQ